MGGHLKFEDELTATYISGDGTEHEEGIFKVIKITPKFMFIDMLEVGYFAQYPGWNIRKIPLQDFKHRKEPMPKWIDENEFICYHKQSGTPTIYKRICKTNV